jgi:hypothetical protein
MFKRLLTLAVLFLSTTTFAQVKTEQFKLKPNESCINMVALAIGSYDLTPLVAKPPRIHNGYVITEFGAVNDDTIFVFQCYKYPDDPVQVLNVHVTPRRTL